MPLKVKLLDLGYLFDYVEGIDTKIAKQSFYTALDEYCNQYICHNPEPDFPNPKPAIIQVAKTTALGNCTPATPFKTEIPSPTFNLKQLFLKVYHVGTANTIWGIQMLLGDSVRSEYTPLEGVSVGIDKTYNPPQGEYITQIEVWMGRVVNFQVMTGIRLSTNKGSRSEIFGTDTGDYHMLNFPAGDQ